MIRTVWFALPVLALGLTAGAQTSVTVAQLEAMLAADQGRSDKELAHELGRLSLKQRLTTARFTRLQAELPGEKARQALLAIADESAFLELPSAEILPTVPPDRAAQKGILSRAVDFVAATVPRMPNFFAVREITRLRSLRPAQDVALDSSQSLPSSSFREEPVRSEPFRLVDTARATVVFRDGKEVVEAPEDNRKKPARVDGLNNWGEFGPLLAVVMSDILAGKIGWFHWEAAPGDPLAVFRYQVDQEKSHYVVRYCCIPSADPKEGNFETVPPYHGEIAIDPATGSVRRFTLETELGSKLPIKRADLAMEYGPVEIGGVSYICPLKSITFSHALSFSFTPTTLVPDSPRGRAYGIRVLRPPEATAINDTAFTGYHLFRGDVRIVPEDSVPAVASPPQPDKSPNP